LDCKNRGQILTKLDDATIPYSGLVFDADNSAAISAGITDMEPEIVAALLTRVVRHVATEAADGNLARPVTVNINITGRAGTTGDVRFSATIDRRTRTLVFISGEALAGGKSILAQTAVYRIVMG
jgi:hypothetical protein